VVSGKCLIHDDATVSALAEEAQQPVADVVGALDPNQADILSAYSTEQGASSTLFLSSALGNFRNCAWLLKLLDRVPLIQQ